MTFSPEFCALMAQYRDTAAGLGHDHPITCRLWALVEATAPDWFREHMHAMAKDMGLLPATYGFDDDGHRLYSLSDVATKLGLSYDEAQQAVEQMITERRAMGLPSDGIIVDGRTVLRMQ